MAETVVIVKFPGQPLYFMHVPTRKISEVSSSISGLKGAAVDISSLYKGFYYVISEEKQDRNHLPLNMEAYLVDVNGGVRSRQIVGPFVICKMPKGLTGPMADMTAEDAAQVQKLLQS